MSNPTADWEKVGGRYYRKTQLYTAVFDQDLELENYIVAGAPYGGAIGMLAPLSLIPPILRPGSAPIDLGHFLCLQVVSLSQ
jgi:hypothetical protein